MIDLQSKCKEFNIIPKGVIHIGAHECQELQTYLAMGVKKIIYVEANPEIYDKIKHLSDNNPNIVIVNCAICDKNGLADFYITNLNQSSSLLKLKKHSDYYPEIIHEKTIKIITRTLDQLLIDIKQTPEDYNILNIDTQGSELSVLVGAQRTLKHIALINSEVNFEELYENCALVDQIDLYLKNINFKRVETVTPYHKSWGDAIYVSDNIIQVSTLGINGRFANQVFQHMFATCYASAHRLKTEFPTWIGTQIFDIKDNPITRSFEQVQLNNDLPSSSDKLINKDVIGWFQYQTYYYLPYKNSIQNIYKFKFKADLFPNKTIVAIHIRMADYGYDDFYITPIKWYYDWLSFIWPHIPDPILYIASDDPEVHKQFSAYNPVTSRDVKEISTQAMYLVDFYVLTKASYVAISNSSFSFLATMLNQNIISCMRPSLSQDKLITYDPWNAEVLLKEKYHPHQTPTPPSIQRKLHIGGQEYHPDWEILNLENTKITNHVGDAQNLYKFEDNTFDEVYASHVLEHFDYLDLPNVLSEWYRVLKPSGTISISVPDLKTISTLLIKSSDAEDQFNLVRMIFGGHIDQNDYHKTGFTYLILKEYLTNAGFKNIELVKLFKNTNFNDTSSMKYRSILISLNFTASKS